MSNYFNLETQQHLQPNGTENPGIRRNSTNPNQTSSHSRLDMDFTQHCINAIGSDASPRAKQIASSLFRHLHDFAREVELTPVCSPIRQNSIFAIFLAYSIKDEWLFGQDLLNQCGKMWADSNFKRNEMHRLSDIFGLESYVHHNHPYASLWQTSTNHPNSHHTASSTKSPTK